MTAARFVDTSFLLALVVSSDQDHAQAQAWFDHWGNESWQVITTEAILTEFLNALSKPANGSLTSNGWISCARRIIILSRLGFRPCC
jgi:predicted nucleic acid-binding protein